jgi:hypothetical protein
MSPLSGVLGEAWALYRRHASHFILISLAVYLVVAVVNALLSWALGGGGVVVGWVVSIVGMYLVQAALVIAVQDVRDGRVDLNLRATVDAAVPFLGAVAVASVFAGIAIAVGFALVVVPGLILLTFWSLLVPEIVIGRSGAVDAFGRSWRTVRGYGWHVFCTFIAMFLLFIVGEFVLQFILIILPVGWRNFFADLIAGALVPPFIATVITLMYFRLTAAHGEQGVPRQDGYGPVAG